MLEVVRRVVAAALLVAFKEEVDVRVIIEDLAEVMVEGLVEACVVTTLDLVLEWLLTVAVCDGGLSTWLNISCLCDSSSNWGMTVECMARVCGNDTKKLNTSFFKIILLLIFKFAK